MEYLSCFCYKTYGTLFLMKFTSMRVRLLFFCFLLLSCSSFANYTFRYKIGADKEYIEHINQDPMIAIFAAIGYEAIYSNWHYDCTANDSLLLLISDISQIGSDDTIRYSQKRKLKGFEIENSFVGKAKDNWPNEYLNKRRKLRSVVSNDTVYSIPYVSFNFKKTDDTLTINGWLCSKWIPVGESADNIKGKVWVWVSKEVPVLVDMYNLSDDFDGGIVRIQFSNGRFNELVSFSKTNDELSFDIFNKRASIFPKSAPMNYLEAWIDMKENFSIKEIR